MPDSRTMDADLLATYVEANPNSRLAYERACRVLPGGVTHELRSFLPFFPYIAGARGHGQNESRKIPRPLSRLA